MPDKVDGAVAPNGARSGAVFWSSRACRDVGMTLVRHGRDREKNFEYYLNSPLRHKSRKRLPRSSPVQDVGLDG